ncbi:F-box protein [Panicum miliaceum]|uniref:F-box protein n=1 Tax=Panicum miliaceum TaxID=4540 RepID=A0A3L6Q790_PANMI|nr:F-box protein [Panicum miliaceum]
MEGESWWEVAVPEDSDDFRNSDCYEAWEPCFLGRYKENLCYINECYFDTDIAIWVLEDYAADEWILKHQWHASLESLPSRRGAKRSTNVESRDDERAFSQRVVDSRRRRQRAARDVQHRVDAEGGRTGAESSRGCPGGSGAGPGGGNASDAAFPHCCCCAAGGDGRFRDRRTTRRVGTARTERTAVTGRGCCSTPAGTSTTSG